jgi:hypothetical protein
MGAERADVLPFGPWMEGLKIAYIESREGVKTVIARRCTRPEACGLCGGGGCRNGGFALLIADGKIPPESCAGFALPPGDG